MTRRLPHNELHQAREQVKGELSSRFSVTLNYYPPGIMRLVGDLIKMGANERTKQSMTAYANHDQKDTAHEVAKLIQGNERFRAVRDAVVDKDKGMQVHLFVTQRGAAVADAVFAVPSAQKEMLLVPQMAGKSPQGILLLLKFALLSLLKFKNKFSVKVQTTNNGILSYLKQNFGFLQGGTLSYAGDDELRSFVARLVGKNSFNSKSPKATKQDDELHVGTEAVSRDPAKPRGRRTRRRRSSGTQLRSYGATLR